MSGDDVPMDGEQMMEAIYVVFETKKDKLTRDDIKKLISWMHSHSEKEKN
jgi:hypothetical protein